MIGFKPYWWLNVDFSDQLKAEKWREEHPKCVDCAKVEGCKEARRRIANNMDACWHFEVKEE